MTADLRRLQRWFAAVMEHPRTADVAIGCAAATGHIPRRAVVAGEVIAVNPRRSIVQSLQVYNGAYLSRLVEVLQGDFGAVHHVLGAHDFERLVARFLQRHPSRHPNLNQLAAPFPPFVQSQRWLPHRPFLVDLARLELCCVRAFDAPEFTALTESQLAEVPPERWGEAVLTTNPSLQLLASRFPVDEFYQAFKDEEPLPVPGPGRSHVAVFRHQDRIWRQRLTRPAFVVLEAIAAGRPLGEALATAGPGAPVAQWFREFAANGLFTGVSLPGTMAT